MTSEEKAKQIANFVVQNRRNAKLILVGNFELNCIFSHFDRDICNYNGLDFTFMGVPMVEVCKRKYFSIVYEINVLP